MWYTGIFLCFIFYFRSVGFGLPHRSFLLSRLAVYVSVSSTEKTFWPRFIRYVAFSF